MKNKIWLIIQREYMTRVKKKSFIIMTILGPILLAGVMLAPMFLMNVENNVNTVAVVDESGMYIQNLQNTGDLVYTKVEDIDSAKAQLQDNRYDMVLYIAKAEPQKPNPTVLYYNKKQPGLGVHNSIESRLQDIFQNELLLEKFNISTEDYEKVKRIKVRVNAQDIRTGEESSTGTKTGLGYVAAFLIYIFVFMFGSQVMQGVIEEKSSRIVEVIVSSVKPFQIMMGKIVGIACVGLTQFLLWIVLTMAIVTVAGSALASNMTDPQAMTEAMNVGGMVNTDVIEQATDNTELTGLINSIKSMNLGFVVLMFLVYFVGGYLLYAALFAAVGSAVENEADTNQFVMPITIPLILALIAMAMVMQNPNGNIAFWFSMIPLTSPIVMMLRVPFGVPTWELALSIGLLIAGFIFTTWLASRIYRVGILMYGKKVTYKELWKWLKY